MDDNETNDIKINQSLLKVFINFLFRCEFLTAFEASLLLRDLRNVNIDDEMQAFEALGKVIEELVQAAFSNVTPFLGALIGSWIMGEAADHISSRYGPFYRKVPGVKDWISA